MLVSTKGRYALRVLIDLAEQSQGERIPLKTIAKRQQISEKYLESIIPLLIQGGFLTGLRGRGGGYQLTRSPEDYSVLSVLQLVEGSMAPVACLADTTNNCNRASECKTLPMWQGFKEQMDEYFGGITIADLCTNQGQDDKKIGITAGL